jgi:hypothetical protein
VTAADEDLRAGYDIQSDSMHTKKTGLSILFCAVLFLAATALLRSQAPTTPDLSGTWQLNQSKSKLPKSAKSEAETVTIICSGPNIEIRYIDGGKDSHDSYDTSVKQKTVVRTPAGEFVTKARWKNGILITEQINLMYFEHQELYHSKESWQLSADGQALTATLDVPRQIRVYDRVPK